MRCPFLRETLVKACQASAYRKLIARNKELTAGELCSSKEYGACPIAREHATSDAQSDRCPFLQESLARFCAGAPIVKYVPYSELINSRCTGDGFSYCPLYLAMAGTPPATEREAEPSFSPLRGRSYTRNHFWIDRHLDGTCHIGIDAFFASLFDTIERVDFVTTKGFVNPAVVFTSHGIAIHAIMPMKVHLVNINTAVRVNPNLVLLEPYRIGWLFEGKTAPASKNENGNGAELLKNGDADTWMLDEVKRLHESVRPFDSAGIAADGGSHVVGLFGMLSREEILRLCHEFFFLNSTSGR